MTTYTVPRHVLEALVHLSQTPPGKPHDASELVRTIVEDGSAGSHEIETLLRDLDPRSLPDFGSMAEWPEHFGFSFVQMGYQPGSKQTSAYMWKRLPSVHLAAFLVMLEGFGLPIDPSPLVEALLPAVRAKKFVDTHDLTLLWYAGTRHKGSGDTIRTEDGIEGEPGSDYFRLKNRYEILVRMRGEAPVSLSVFRPFKLRTYEVVETHCPHCLQTYHRGDHDSVQSHKREHARLKPAFAPTPSASLAALPAGPERGIVSWNSPAWMQRAVYLRAVLFRRDQGYDFVQWAEKGEDHPDVVGYLIEDDSGTFPEATIVGATCFRKRRGRWEMDWVWLCPEARRKGILGRRWPWFTERFGDYGLTYPLSKAMQAFVESRPPGVRA